MKPDDRPWASQAGWGVASAPGRPSTTWGPGTPAGGALLVPRPADVIEAGEPPPPASGLGQAPAPRAPPLAPRGRTWPRPRERPRPRPRPEPQTGPRAARGWADRWRGAEPCTALCAALLAPPWATARAGPTSSGSTPTSRTRSGAKRCSVSAARALPRVGTAPRGRWETRASPSPAVAVAPAPVPSGHSSAPASGRVGAPLLLPQGSLARVPRVPLPGSETPLGVSASVLGSRIRGPEPGSELLGSAPQLQHPGGGPRVLGTNSGRGDVAGQGCVPRGPSVCGMHRLPLEGRAPGSPEAAEFSLVPEFRAG